MLLENLDRNDIEISIGKRIKIRRKFLKITQKSLANILGISFQQLQKYESGQNSIKASFLVNLCGILNVNLDYFFSEIKFCDNDEYMVVEPNTKLEVKLLSMFRSLDNEEQRAKIVKIFEALILTIN